jgi:foldase protein PrsA
MIKEDKPKMGTDIKVFIAAAILIALGSAVLFYFILQPKTVVEINGKKVNAAEFQYYFTQNLSTAMQSQSSSTDVNTFLSSAYGEGTVKDELKKQTLSQIVQIKVLLLKEKQDKLKADRSEIDEAWKTFENSLLANAQNSQLSLNEFSKKAYGTSLKNVEKYYKEYVESQKYMSAKSQEVAVDEKELTKFYTDNKSELDRAVIRHILISCEKGASNEAEKKKQAESILDRVNKGEDFAALAKEYSEDPGSKDNGGIYEIHPNGQMVTEFEDWAFSHKAKDTGIIRTTYGFHVMKLDSIYNTLESQRKDIELTYKLNKYQSQLNESLSGNQYKIEVQEAYSKFKDVRAAKLKLKIMKSPY